MRWPFVNRRERLRREAADWIARLNAPYDEADRAEFERWYDSSPQRAEAYERLSRLFQAAGMLVRPENAPDPGRATNRGRAGPRRLGYALAAALAGVLLAFLFLSARTASPLPGSRQQIAALAAGAGSRAIVLADGSQILLSPRSAVEVELGSGERRLRLVRGEGRFSVAREARPFVVSAGGAQIVARGTEFVVRLAGGRTLVSLLEGRIDISYVAAAGDVGRRQIARLRPGQSLVVEAGGAPAAAAPAGSEAVQRPGAVPAMLQFDETPLGEAVERVNRHGSPPIRLRDPALARLRITGAYRLGDTAGFAQSVAAAFAVEVEWTPDGTIWLKAR